MPAIIAVILFFGCSKVVPSDGVTLSAAHEKFLQTCTEEFKYNITTKQIDNTSWIYVPIENNIVDIKATDKGPFSSNKAKEALSMRYVGAKFNGNSLNIEYDVAMTKGYAKSYGYSSIYTEEYSKIQNNVLLALKNSFFDVGTIKGDLEFTNTKKAGTHKKLVDSYVKTDTPPEFFVVVISDIKKGIEIEILLNFDDYKKAMSPNPVIPHEEYTKRYLTEIRGSSAIVNDTTGAHLNYRSITMQNFLSRQIINRINFKYTKSDFTPENDAQKEILKIIATTLRLYDFKDFETVNLKNLNTDTAKTITKNELKEYETEKKSTGKYHVIKFF